MKDVFKLFVNNELPCSQAAIPTELDTKLSQEISMLEDCFKQGSCEVSNAEILERVDNIVELCTKISDQRFVEGMKIGIAMGSQSQQFVNQLEHQDCTSKCNK